jgi:hypothetical protein
MHEDYDNEYDDDEYDYDHPSLNPYQYYFKFDIGPNTPLSQWLSDIVNDFMGADEDYKMINIPGFPPKMFPVNSWNPNTGKANTYQYLGSNYSGEPIWKPIYFVHDKFHTDYINHLKHNAVYFIQQPSYYKSLYNILN